MVGSLLVEFIGGTAVQNRNPLRAASECHGRNPNGGVVLLAAWKFPMLGRISGRLD